MNDEICPRCGNSLAPARRDGTHRRDGSINRSGYVCPICIAKIIKRGVSQYRDQIPLSNHQIESAMQCLSTVQLDLERVDSLPDELDQLCSDPTLSFFENIQNKYLNLGASVKGQLSAMRKYVSNKCTKENLNALICLVQFLSNTCTDPENLEMMSKFLGFLWFLLFMKYLPSDKKDKS